MSRISPGTLTIGILAVLVGLGGAYALRVYLQPKPVAEQPKPAVDQTQVPIASMELPAGRIIRYGDIGMVLRRSMGTPPRPNTMLNTNDIIGRVLKKPMAPGDTFVTTGFYPQGTGPSIAEKLKSGLRAVTVPIDNLGTVGGHVNPGVKVDVLFRADKKEDKEGFEQIPEMTVTLFEGVEVLAVGENPHAVRPAADDDKKEPLTEVTLACSPSQANKLRAVLGHGEIALSMWPDAALDTQTIEVSTPAVTLENILGVAPKRPFKTEVYRRGQRSVNAFRGNTGVTVTEFAAADPATANPAAADSAKLPGGPADGQTVSSHGGAVNRQPAQASAP